MPDYPPLIVRAGSLLAVSAVFSNLLGSFSFDVLNGSVAGAINFARETIFFMVSFAVFISASAGIAPLIARALGRSDVRR